MSTSQPLTYERVLEMFLESDRRLVQQREETDRAFQELAAQVEKTTAQVEKTTAQVEKTSRKVESLSSTVGNLIENLISGGNIIKKFRELNYVVTKHSQNIYFGEGEEDSGEIDLLLENGDIVILVEVKTTLETQDVRNHIKRIEKYRRYSEKRGDKRRFLGVVAAANVHEKTAQYALDCGFYAIVQTGDAFKILDPPPGFVAKEW